LARIPVVSIVDDDPSVRTALDSLVRSLDFVACVFTSGREFLESPRLHDTDCVIADIQMPGMSGLELQQLLHARSFDIPMIFVTAFADRKVREQALAAGAVGFFDKPFDGARIAACIERAIGERNRNRPLKK
jgi:FixJ family two-component response regulator